MKIRIGLLGMYGSANLGDTAIQTVVLDNLRSRRLNIEFVGISQDPEDVTKTFNIDSFPASGDGHAFVSRKSNTTYIHKRFIPQALRNINFVPKDLNRFINIERQMLKLDMLIVSGGGQLDDFWGGPWAQPFQLFSWCFSAKLHGKPIAVFAVGVDEVPTSSSVRSSVHRMEVVLLVLVRANHPIC